MKAPVSVIIPCYRCAETVGKAMDSIAQQTLRPAEVIFVEDGSDDKTLETLRVLQNTYGGDWVRVIALERNQGASVARNTGWDIATQEYIAFLDADDFWHPRKIELQYNWMQKHPEIIGTGHEYVIVEPEAILPDSTVDAFHSVRVVTRKQLLFSNPFVTPAVMLKRDSNYRFDPGKRYCEDYYLWLQIVLDRNPMVLLNTPLVYISKRIGKTGTSRHLWKMRTGDINNYWRLWRTGKLDALSMGAAIIFSSMKFILLILAGPERHYSLKRKLEGIWSGLDA